jgi:hypothetical protein
MDNRDYAREELVNMVRDVIWSDLISAMFTNWCPFPDKAYCELVGWEVNAGTVDTPDGFRIPTQELCEIEKLEQLYELE